MKKVKTLLISLLALALAFTVCACGDSIGEASFELKDAIVWLDRYGEQTVTLNKGDAASLTWTSADETIVTVSEGRLIAMGEGETTVTVSDGKISASFTVRVNDSGAKPAIGLSDTVAYIGIETPLPLSITYNEDTMPYSGTFSVTAADTDLIEVSGTTIKGKAEGTTTLTITAEYKGLSLTRTVDCEVLQSSFVNLPSDTLEVYDAESDLATAEVTASVIYLGETLVEPSLTLTVISGGEFFSVEGNVVTAVAEGSGVIRVAYSEDGTIYSDLDVVVHPNYIAEKFNPNILYDVTYEPYVGTIGGRSEGLYQYNCGELVQTPGQGSDFWHRRVEASRNGDSLIEMYRSGLRYFAYDVYYTSNARIYLGMDRANPQFYEVNTALDSENVTILKDGKITNRVERDTWITVVYDLYYYALNYSTEPCGFYFAVDDQNSTCYLDNIRYYLDDTFLPENPRVYTEKDGYVAATNDEFIPYLSTSAETYRSTVGEVGGVAGAYEYRAPTNDGVWVNALALAPSIATTYSNGMNKLIKNGRVLTFDLYISSASRIGMYVNHTSSIALLPGISDVSAYDWLTVIRDGYKRYTIEKNVWQTIVIDFDELMLTTPASDSLTTILLGAPSRGNLLYLNDVRYYPDKDFIPTDFYGIRPPSDVAVYRSGASVENVVEGEFNGTVKYVNKTFGMGSSDDGDKYDSGLIFLGAVSPSFAPQANFFNGTNKYVKFDFYLNSAVNRIDLFSWATVDGVGEQYWRAMRKGFNPDNSQISDNIYVYNREDMTFSGEMLAENWYTAYLPVAYTGTSADLQWAKIYFEISGTVPATIDGETVYPEAYIDNVEFTATNPYEFTGYFTSTKDAKLAKGTGEFADAVKYTNASGGKTNGNWGSGLRFTGLQRRSDNFAAFRKSMTFDFYLDSSVASITIQNMVSSTGSGQTGTYVSWNVGANKPVGLSVYKVADKSVAIKLETGVWYTAVIDLDYSSLDPEKDASENSPGGVTWAGVYFMTSIATAGEGSAVAYVKNTAYHTATPTDYSPILPLNTTSSSATVESSGEFAGAIKYTNTTGGATASVWDAGVAFDKLQTYGGAPKPTFFDGSNRYVKFDIYLASDNITSISLYASAMRSGVQTVALYEKNAAIGTPFGNNIYIFEGGTLNPVSTIATKTWFTVVIPVYYETPIDWTRVHVMTNGNVTDGALVSYIRNVSFEKEEGKYLLRDIYAGAVDNAADAATVSMVTGESDLAGSIKVSSTKHRYQNGAGWNAGNASFRSAAGNGIFFTAGCKYIVFDVYIEAGTNIVMTHRSTLSAENNGPFYGRYDVDAAPDYGDKHHKIYNLDGTVPETIERNTWYRAVMYIDYTAGVPNWTAIMVQADGGTDANPSVFYLKNLHYEAENPFPTA